MVGSLLPREQDVVVEYSPGCLLQFRLSDGYWARLVSRSYVYEPEIWLVLRHFRDKTHAVFLDCGANYGYWSIALSGPEFGWKQVVAIEASPSTYECLTRNRELNADRFKSLNRAIYSASGVWVSVGSADGHHASASISVDGGHSSVETVTVDDLVSANCPQPASSIILKLDVEGVEIDALAGASKSLASDTLIIYEDHGNDPDSKVTAHILLHLDANVYFVTDEERILQIGSAEDARRQKRNAGKGYNFFAAVRGSDFDNRLRELSQRP